MIGGQLRQRLFIQQRQDGCEEFTFDLPVWSTLPGILQALHNNLTPLCASLRHGGHNFNSIVDKKGDIFGRQHGRGWLSSDNFPPERLRYKLINARLDLSKQRGKELFSQGLA